MFSTPGLHMWIIGTWAVPRGSAYRHWVLVVSTPSKQMQPYLTLYEETFFWSLKSQGHWKQHEKIWQLYVKSRQFNLYHSWPLFFSGWTIPLRIVRLKECTRISVLKTSYGFRQDGGVGEDDCHDVNLLLPVATNLWVILTKEKCTKRPQAKSSLHVGTGCLLLYQWFI